VFFPVVGAAVPCIFSAVTLALPVWMQDMYVDFCCPHFGPRQLSAARRAACCHCAKPTCPLLEHVPCPVHDLCRIIVFDFLSSQSSHTTGKCFKHVPDGFTTKHKPIAASVTTTPSRASSNMASFKATCASVWSELKFSEANIGKAGIWTYPASWAQHGDRKDARWQALQRNPKLGNLSSPKGA
jgi:hypothetical protein